MKLNALIVDDENSGRTSLKILLSRNYYYLFENITTSNSLEEAIEISANNYFHICFLDIQLDTKSGFELLPYLSKQTKVIFVTAFSEYAISAIREKAFDYLLKPINPLELKACINRYEKEYLTEENSSQYLSIKVQGETTPIRISDIEYIEAAGAYCSIHLTDNKDYTTAKTLKVMVDIVGNDFIRIHKTYLVNKAMVKSFKKDTLTTTKNTCLPVSRIGAKELSQHF
jgi:two-component system LytT family response regulator